MATRERAPEGAPCWADLWTSDVEGARRFYGEVFDWVADAPNPEFGGYFMFTRDGVPVAGAMGDMPGMAATNSWKIYLSTGDITRTVEAAAAGGAQVVSGAMAVGDIGIQAVLLDPTGAHLGVWQPLVFAGFTVLAEPGTPGWFELQTRDHQAAVEFYRSVFHWDLNVAGDSDEFRYTTMRNPDGGEDLAGIMDARNVMAVDQPASWSVYWVVGDIDATAEKAARLGGQVLSPPGDTPFGRLATIADPCGAEFKLHAPVR